MQKGRSCPNGKAASYLGAVQPAAALTLRLWVDRRPWSTRAPKAQPRARFFERMNASEKLSTSGMFHAFAGA